MARALIVGCGCRGRDLAKALAEEGWAVRGTSRSRAGLEEISSAGIEAVEADPDRPATVLDAIDGVAVVYWLMGSVRDEPEVVAAIHGPRLERFLEKIVDTPVRGFVYEAAGPVQDHRLAAGAEIVDRARQTWNLRAESVTADPADHEAWLRAMITAGSSVLGRPARS